MRRLNEEINDIPGYFTLQNCLQGLKILVKSLFDIHVEEVPKKEWSNESWHPSVIKLRFSNASVSSKKVMTC